MPDLDSQISFVELLKSCQRIVVPRLQRDFAQGRDTAKEVREGFLNALYEALVRPADEAASPLNLDFVYGSMEDNGGKQFVPLDGQQRLTTLLLLHWYLAWQDGVLPEFQAIAWDGRHSRFSYAVRPSSKEFFDELAQYVPDKTPQQAASVKRLIENQPWFYLHWRLDPTIQSALAMLDAIQERFADSHGLFARLRDTSRPAITFQLLPLEHFGLSDDLYIKMNARGKPLTLFETFKARYEENLKQMYPTERREIGGALISVHEFFSQRMDTQWTDFFWSYRADGNAGFDAEVMNLFWSVAWVSINPDRSPGVGPAVTRYRDGVGSYTDFHELGLLTRAFSDNLVCLLESWSKGGAKLTPQLPNARYFAEAAFFEKARTTPTKLEYSELVMFAAFTSYLRANEGNVNPTEFQEWMRVVFNLVQNSDIERPDDYERSLGGLQKLLPHSREILSHLATVTTEPFGFSRDQVQEEILKAQLILAMPDWGAHLQQAEAHGYFRGQIGFLLEFSGVRTEASKRPVQDWTPGEHTQLQESFDNYWAKAQLTFNEQGLASLPGEAHQWQRSLLAVGDYLVPLGRNYSFATDPPGNPDSWKRWLRGAAGGASRRNHLKTLWDRLDLSSEVGSQLARIRETADLEPWRAAIVTHPQVIDYCSQREIRQEQGAKEIYLLRKRQMNGAHAELFTFVLHLELSTVSQQERLAPLELGPYESVAMTETKPHFVLSIRSARFTITSKNNEFQVAVVRTGLATIPGAERMLVNELQFSQGDESLDRFVTRDEAVDFLVKLAGSLKPLTSAT